MREESCIWHSAFEDIGLSDARMRRCEDALAANNSRTSNSEDRVLIIYRESFDLYLHRIVRVSSH